MTIPHVAVPDGFEVVIGDNGDLVVRQRDESLKHTVAFRLTSSEYTVAKAFVETFPQRRWGEAFRWLLNHPGVRDVIAERVASR